MKRLSVCILVATGAIGCAGHPEQPAPVVRQPVAASAVGGAPVAVAAPAAGAPAATTNGAVTKQVPVTLANATEVQHAGYKIVNKEGQKLYCRTDPITGSRLQTRTVCLTEQELYDQMHETQNAMSHVTQQQTQSFSGK
jgi:hypothetical protein